METTQQVTVKEFLRILLKFLLSKCKRAFRRRKVRNRMIAGFVIIFCMVLFIKVFVAYAQAPAMVPEEPFEGEKAHVELPILEVQDIHEEVYEEVTEITAEPELSAMGPGEVYYYNLSDEDKLYLAKLVYKEAGCESLKGKTAVAAVVLNRVVSEDFPDNVYDVITQKCQFAKITKVTDGILEENPECMEAVEAACKGWDPTREQFEEGAKYFYNPSIVTGYEKAVRTNIKVLSIGGHNFHNSFNFKAGKQWKEENNQ